MGTRFLDPSASVAGRAEKAAERSLEVATHPVLARRSAGGFGILPPTDCDGGIEPPNLLALLVEEPFQAWDRLRVMLELLERVLRLDQEPLQLG